MSYFDNLMLEQNLLVVVPEIHLKSEQPWPGPCAWGQRTPKGVKHSPSFQETLCQVKFITYKIFTQENHPLESKLLANQFKLLILFI